MNNHCRINGETCQQLLDEHTTLATLLLAQGYLTDINQVKPRLLVAVNERIVAAADWGTFPVQANDRIDVMAAVTGG
jgi:thiamine biosynthesis protein ThiS